MVKLRTFDASRYLDTEEKENSRLYRPRPYGLRRRKVHRRPFVADRTAKT